MKSTKRIRLINVKLLALALASCVGVNPLSAATHSTVESIADLRNTIPGPGDTVTVLDYYGIGSPNRGRSGGLFRAVPTSSVPLSADDGGKYIATVNTSNIWERVFNGEVPNVRMWGAVGDGVADDTQEIQNAVNAVRHNRVGGGYSGRVGNEILFPGGTYLITDTIMIPAMLIIRGEGTHGTTVKMSTNYVDRDIFRTLDADNHIKGWAANPVDPTIAHPGSWFYNSLGTINFNPLRVEDITLSFGDYATTEQTRANQTGAGICMTLPLETSEIRNIGVFGGGYGVRVIGPGTPGVKIHNSEFFYQSIASVCVEGLKYRQTSNGPDLFAASGGPATLSSLAGDSFYAGQASQNSFILFTNCVPTVAITDLSLEGAYGQGAIRCVLPPNATAPYAYINIRNGTINSTYSPSGVVKDFVVLRNSHSSSYKMPDVTIEGFAMYGIRNIISDDWQPRFVPASFSYNNQLPVRRPLYYASGGTYSPLEKRSLLVYGDTAYFSFTPTTTGWKRVLLTYGADSIFGGRLAINSATDSSELSFNLTPLSNEITVNRTSRNAGGGWVPCVSKVRGYTFWQGIGYRQAIDIYVSNILSTSLPPEKQEITLTLPLEGRIEISNGHSSLISPIDLEATSTNPTPNPAVSGETYNSSVGPISLLR